MSFIDWSDTEEMIGLLVDYVADERSASIGDRERGRFLENLLLELEAVLAPPVPVDQMIELLRGLSDATPEEFASDCVVGHVRDCIVELERIRAQGR